MAVRKRSSRPLWAHETELTVGSNDPDEKTLVTHAGKSGQEKPDPGVPRQRPPQSLRESFAKRLAVRPDAAGDEPESSNE
jgi:hypothetical protein